MSSSLKRSGSGAASSGGTSPKKMRSLSGAAIERYPPMLTSRQDPPDSNVGGSSSSSSGSASASSSSGSAGVQHDPTSGSSIGSSSSSSSSSVAGKNSGADPGAAAASPPDGSGVDASSILDVNGSDDRDSAETEALQTTAALGNVAKGRILLLHGAPSSQSTDIVADAAKYVGRRDISTGSLFYELVWGDPVHALPSSKVDGNWLSAAAESSKGKSSSQRAGSVAPGKPANGSDAVIRLGNLYPGLQQSLQDWEVQANKAFPQFGSQIKTVFRYCRGRRSEETTEVNDIRGGAGQLCAGAWIDKWLTEQHIDALVRSHQPSAYVRMFGTKTVSIWSSPLYDYGRLMKRPDGEFQAPRGCALRCDGTSVKMVKMDGIGQFCEARNACQMPFVRAELSWLSSGV